MSDPIATLPLDSETALSSTEQAFLDMYFPSESTLDIRVPILLSILFGMLSLPYVDNLLSRVLPANNSTPLYVIGLKTILFGLVVCVLEMYREAEKN